MKPKTIEENNKDSKLMSLYKIYLRKSDDRPAIIWERFLILVATIFAEWVRENNYKNAPIDYLFHSPEFLEHLESKLMEGKG